ncbi:WbuC family cupin fold metalloprotein [Chitinibacteraceae bacterium HSL-7]
MTFINLADLDVQLAAARVHARQRVPRLLHAHADEPCQRLVNALTTSSYVRPHRHLQPDKSETLIALAGHLGVLTFDDGGNVVDRMRLGLNAPGVLADIAPSVWHSVVPLTDCVLFECKAGPFVALSDDELAPFAPAEGSAEVPAYLAFMRAQFE